jgi:hypothetical protein
MLGLAGEDSIPSTMSSSGHLLVKAVMEEKVQNPKKKSNWSRWRDNVLKALNSFRIVINKDKRKTLGKE